MLPEEMINEFEIKVEIKIRNISKILFFIVSQK